MAQGAAMTRQDASSFIAGQRPSPMRKQYRGAVVVGNDFHGNMPAPRHNSSRSPHRFRHHGGEEIGVIVDSP